MTWRTCVQLLLSGMLFGLTASALNHGIGPYTAYTSKVMGNSWAWLLAAFIAAWPAKSGRTASARGGAFLYAAVAAYYVTDLFAGTYTREAQIGGVHGAVDAQGVAVDVVFYLILSTVTAALLGLLVAAIRRGGVLGALGTLVVPVYITKTALDRRDTALAWPHDPVMAAVSGAIALMAATSTALIIILGIRRALLGTRTQRTAKRWRARPLWPPRT